MITVEITPGELVDRLTILQLKLDHCSRADQRSRLRTAIERANAARRAARIEGVSSSASWARSTALSGAPRTRSAPANGELITATRSWRSRAQSVA